MNTDNTFSRGRFVPALASTIAQAKPRLVNKYGDYDSDMYEIPGWGFIIPVESAVNDYEQLYLDFATRGLPAGTMLGMRWTPPVATEYTGLPGAWTATKSLTCRSPSIRHGCLKRRVSMFWSNTRSCFRMARRSWAKVSASGYPGNSRFQA